VSAGAIYEGISRYKAMRFSPQTLTTWWARKGARLCFLTMTTARGNGNLISVHGAALAIPRAGWRFAAPAFLWLR